MPSLTYVQQNGDRRVVAALSGMSVMEVAVDNDVPGILAECGGAGACATCHVYVAPDWFAKLEPADPIELDMLEAVQELGPTSRLSCQLIISNEFDGMEIKVPARQQLA